MPVLPFFPVAMPSNIAVCIFALLLGLTIYIELYAVCQIPRVENLGQPYWWHGKPDAVSESLEHRQLNIAKGTDYVINTGNLVQAPSTYKLQYSYTGNVSFPDNPYTLSFIKTDCIRSRCLLNVAQDVESYKLLVSNALSDLHTMQ